MLNQQPGSMLFSPNNGKIYGDALRAVYTEFSGKFKCHDFNSGLLIGFLSIEKWLKVK